MSIFSQYFMWVILKSGEVMADHNLREQHKASQKGPTFFMLVAQLLLLHHSFHDQIVFADTSSGTQPHNKNTRQRASTGESNEEDCHSIIRGEKELRLLERLQKINNRYFSGESSTDERDEAVRKLLSELNPTKDPKTDGVIKSTIALNNEIASSLYLLPLAMKKLKGLPLEEYERKILKGIGIPDNEAEKVVAQKAEELRPEFEALINAPHESSNGYGFGWWGWDLEGMELTVDSLGKNPQIKKALMTFFSPKLVMGLEDPNRSEAIVAGNNVFLPPIGEERNIRVLSRDEYERLLHFHLEEFGKAAREYIRGSQKASSYTDSMRGRLTEDRKTQLKTAQGFVITSPFYGVFQKELDIVFDFHFRKIDPLRDPHGKYQRGYEGKTAAELDKDSALNFMKAHQRTISDILGYRGELREQMDAAMAEVLDIDNHNLSKLISFLDVVEKGARLAPLIPVAMYVAPFAGAFAGWGSGSTLLAAGTVKATTAFITIPLAIGAIKSLYSASVLQAHFGGNWFCWFSEQFQQQGAAALYGAGKYSLIPSAVASASGLAGLGAPAMGLNATAIAETTQGLLNLGVAANFLSDLLPTAASETRECWRLIEKAKKEKKTEIRNALASEAWIKCGEAGIDLEFARQMTKASVESAMNSVSRRSGAGGGKGSSGKESDSSGATVVPIPKLERTAALDGKETLPDNMLGRILSESGKTSSGADTIIQGRGEPQRAPGHQRSSQGGQLAVEQLAEEAARRLATRDGAIVAMDRNGDAGNAARRAADEIAEIRPNAFRSVMKGADESASAVERFGLKPLKSFQVDSRRSMHQVNDDAFLFFDNQSGDGVSNASVNAFINDFLPQNKGWLVLMGHGDGMKTNVTMGGFNGGEVVDHLKASGVELHKYKGVILVNCDGGSCVPGGQRNLAETIAQEGQLPVLAVDGKLHASASPQGTLNMHAESGDRSVSKLNPWHSFYPEGKTFSREHGQEISRMQESLNQLHLKGPTQARIGNVLPERHGFVAPNEKTPEKAIPILERVRPGTYVAVGTERGFISASLAPNVTRLLLVDMNPQVVNFNRVNTALLAMANNRIDYLALRLVASREVWLRRAKYLNPKYRQLIEEPTTWEWWKNIVRENEEFKDFHALSGENFRNANYLRNDTQFNRIHDLARKGKIESEVVDLSDLKEVKSLVQTIKASGDTLSALDISNAWDSGDYIPTKNLAKLLEEFQPVAKSDSMLILTKPHFAQKPSDSFSGISKGKNPESMSYSAYTFDQFEREGEPSTFAKVLTDLEGGRGEGGSINRQNIQPGSKLTDYLRCGSDPCPQSLFAPRSAVK